MERTAALWLIGVHLCSCGRPTSSPAEAEAALSPVAIDEEIPAAVSSTPDPARRQGDSPFALLLDQPEAGMFRATLCNASGEAQPVLSGQLSSHVRLDLVHGEHGVLEPYDSWSVRSSSGIYPCAGVSTLDAGQSIELARAAVSWVEGRRELVFSSLVWRDLPAGEVRARAKVHAFVSRCEPPGAQPELWTGELESGEITAQIGSHP